MDQVRTAAPAAPANGHRLQIAWPNRLGGRRGMFLLATAVIVAGLALNWNWLAAVGVAPILLAFAPCAAMCALGLCMRGGSGKSCSQNGPADAARKTEGEPAA